MGRDGRQGTLTTTEVGDGTVRGERIGGVSRFRGIPFAAPPTGSRRWRPPQPPTPWAGVRDCLAPGPIPPQPISSVDAMIGGRELVQSEDCLNLNVWTPACDDARRPVLVWMYGGGFAIGTGASPLSDGSRLAADGDVVVVTFNYRLGLLGFLPVGSVLDERFSAAGNAGVLDAVAALRWVRDNITAFGGDPDNITAFGQSAGGALAALAVALPEAQGLTQRCIVQSSGFHIVHPAHEVERVGRLNLEVLGVDVGAPDRLYELPLEAFSDAFTRLSATYVAQAQEEDFTTATMLLQPAVDGSVIPDDPHELLARSSPDVELLVGNTAEELYLSRLRTPGSSPPDERALRSRVARWFGGADGRAAGDDVVDRVLAVYRSGRPDASLDDLWLALVTDAWVHAPTRRLARAHPGPRYMYRFTLRGAGYGEAPVSYHGLDIPFPWQTIDADGAQERLGEVTDGARRLAAVMSRTWATFARSGVPADRELPEWPVWDPERPTMMRLDETCSLIDDPEHAEHALWDDLDVTTTAVAR